MGACAIGQAHDQVTLPLVLGAAEELERQTRARVIGIMNVNFFRSLILSSMSLPRCSGFSTTSASRPSRHASARPAGRPPGTTRPSRPYPTGTPWPNRNPSTSSTSRCSGSRLPSPGRAGDAPLPVPAVIVPSQTPSGTLPNGGLLPALLLSATVRSHFALAEPRRSMLRSPDTSHRAVGFPIPPIPSPFRSLFQPGTVLRLLVYLDAELQSYLTARADAKADGLGGCQGRSF